MLVKQTTLGEYHDYSVEWEGSDLVYRLGGEGEIVRVFEVCLELSRACGGEM